ncbi:sigma-70 family RNA polymerase sigma factor [Gemmata sp. G18]|uniref:Sigma-70 family RNA polymerase sigma factor n=1 Tax=Gemmata palustris TaxID=2822762 RepID=A0ABS5C2D3_9BACT|nr:sigma-70 family RNA polymerase sigma factor [Gemmata palustris]MBP3960151.1 sigma-70 family RNA polymerase sigma factor [Gemmata palustris]
MPTSLLHAVSRLTAGADDPRTDAHLIAAFLKSTDQDAFAELVRRHGPAVLGVCRRFLGATPDAEDAFQATFLVLVARARGTDWRDALGPWLYGVAIRVARRARATRAKRLANERQVPAMSDPPIPASEPDDASAVLDEELAALPAIYRLPLILCEIQGTGRRVAARELGLTEGTLSSRLARGRKMLRNRLAQRGLASVTTGLTLTVPAPLANATVRNAVHVLTRTAGAVPAGVLFLTQGTVKSMLVKWKLAGAMIAACLGLTGLGAWHTSAQPPTPAALNQPAHALMAPQEKAPVPRVKIVAIVGANNVITDQEVIEAVYQMSQEKKPSAELVALGWVARVAMKKEIYKQVLRKTIERELIIDEMCAKLKKVNKTNVIDEVQEFAAQSAARQMRAFRTGSGAQSDEAFAAALRAQGRSVPVIRRQMERQVMAEQYVSSALKESGTEYKKLVEDLWRKGVVRVFEE